MSVYLVSKKVQEIICEAKIQGHVNLYLNYQQLKELPDELLELGKVEKIFLKYNILEKLPSKIWKLQSLVELYLHSNHLETLPEEIGQVHCLKSLNICSNYLKTLPSAIGDLSGLQDLHLACNQLNALPESLGRLHSLKILDVMNNNLTMLPWQLCNCSKLETLHIDGNKIQWIPHQLTQLRQLKELSASRNRLTCIPQDIDKMVLLENLLLDSNTSFCAIPATVLRLENLVMVGLNRCGNQSNTELSNNIADLSRSFQDIAFIGSLMQSVCPMLELCLRAAYKFFNSSFLSRNDLIPNNLAAVLKSPSGHCYHCGQPFFIGIFALTTNVKKARKITRGSEIDINTKLPVLFSLCSFNCLKVVEGLLRDVT